MGRGADPLEGRGERGEVPHPRLVRFDRDDFGLRMQSRELTGLGAAAGAEIEDPPRGERRGRLHRRRAAGILHPQTRVGRERLGEASGPVPPDRESRPRVRRDPLAERRQRCLGAGNHDRRRDQAVGGKSKRSVEAVGVDPVEQELAAVTRHRAEPLDRVLRKHRLAEPQSAPVLEGEDVAATEPRVDGERPCGQDLLAQGRDASQHRVGESARSAADATRGPGDGAVDDGVIRLVVEQKQLRRAAEQDRLHPRLQTSPRPAIERRFDHRRECEPSTPDLSLDGPGERRSAVGGPGKAEIRESGGEFGDPLEGERPDVGGFAFVPGVRGADALVGHEMPVTPWRARTFWHRP